MWTLLKAFIELITILLLFDILVFCSSLTRNQTHIPHIGRQSLKHWTTREGTDCKALKSVLGVHWKD